MTATPQLAMELKGTITIISFPPPSHHICAEVVISICIDMLVIISVQRRLSACEWKFSSAPLYRGSSLYVNSDAIQHLCAEAAFSILIDMLVSISVRRQPSACDWRCLSVPLCRGGALHANGDGCQHLSAEAALCM